MPGSRPLPGGHLHPGDLGRLDKFRQDLAYLSSSWRGTYSAASGEHPCRLGAYEERSAGVVPQPEVDQRGITATRSLSDSAETAHSLLSWSVSRTTAAGMSITPYGRLEPRSNRIIRAPVHSDIRIKIP